MVLLGLALSIRGFFRHIRLTALASRRRNAPDLETAIVMEDERAVGVGVAVVERERVEWIGERVVDRGFMTAARVTSSTQPIRTGSSKRKLEELEITGAESSASANRARREARDEALEGSIAESSGRERYDGGISVSGEAQALDGESQMREEVGNEAIDADAMWEEEPGWNKTLEIVKVLPEEKFDEIGGAEGNSEYGGSLNSTFVVSLVDGGSHTLMPASNLFVINSGDAPSDAGSTGIELVEEETAGRDVESVKEPDVDTSRARDRERESASQGHDEDFSIKRYGLFSNVSLAGLEPGASSSGTAQGSTSLSAGGSSLGGSASDSGNGGDVSCSPRRMDGDIHATPCRLQFFVRTYIDSRTVVLHANASDSIESVHRQIFLRTGLPVCEQRLIFGGRQLQQDQSLESYNVGNDATLNLVGRMRSTALPHSWQLVNDLVATIRRMCAAGDGHTPNVKLMHTQDCVRAGVHEFLKMASKSIPVSEHMQVFQLAGATSALVMLLLSPVESNRECSEEAIGHFLQANDDYLPAHVHCHCAPVLLEFCKLLSKSAPNHSLYSSCRNALARLLDTVGVAHGTAFFNEAKADSIVHDFSPFVNELSMRLTVNLQWMATAYHTKESINFTPYVKEAKDFTAFVIPLCKAMEVCKGIDTSGSGDKVRIDDTFRENFSAQVLRGLGHCDSSPFLAMEVGTRAWILGVFHALLLEIGKCLEAVDQGSEKSQEVECPALLVSDDQEKALGWAPFLIVLKGLNAIAKLYEGTAQEFLDMLCAYQGSLNALIRQSKWQDDDFWLLEHKDLLDFESKRKLVMAMLPEPQDDHDERQEIAVHRSQLLTESFELLAYVESDVLHGGLSVEFLTEEATGPGVLREWFSMICREIFNPQNALFLPCPNDLRRFYPNPASGVNPGHLTYFRFCGRVISLALMHRVQVDVVFALAFFKQLAGIPISWEDAKDADPFLYESCKKILEMDPETVDSDVLGLTFTSEVEELGTRKTLELCQGGKDMVVNSDNRRQFVELLVERRLVASVAEQIKSFSQGFSDLLVNATHQQFLRALEPEDLDLLIYGKDRNICLDDWRAHTEYHDYAITDDPIIWFWQVLEDMSPELRQRLLFFSTSVTHLPAEGFAGLSSRFHIHRAHTDISWLPTAHTCFYQLVLPPYPTYEIMYTRLHAITELHVSEGFGFA